eukprot:TRINITY_DN23231_c0_g1_i2.p1 TRINITY_DN23231_c0_g1~~TRINITY_DN23231_c0_g1_i2.p1  ORF type:complete len:171 (+),score=30.95 TRINITY_DN23231_c0_g1_i2:52-564(+)
MGIVLGLDCCHERQDAFERRVEASLHPPRRPEEKPPEDPVGLMQGRRSRMRQSLAEAAADKKSGDDAASDQLEKREEEKVWISNIPFDELKPEALARAAEDGTLYKDPRHGTFGTYYGVTEGQIMGHWQELQDLGRHHSPRGQGTVTDEAWDRYKDVKRTWPGGSGALGP